MVATLASGGHILLPLGHALGDRTGQEIRPRGCVGNAPQPIGGLAAEALAGVDVAVGVDREEHAQAVAKRADLPMATRDTATHLVERRYGDLAPMEQVVVQHGPEQISILLWSKRMVRVTAFERRDGWVNRQAQTLADEEVQHLAPARGTGRREGGDAADAHAVRSGLADARHGPVEVAPAALCVRDVLWPIQTCANVHSVVGEELAVLVVQKPQIALETDFVTISTEPGREAVQRLSPDRVPCREGLAAVERDLDLPLPRLLGDTCYEVENRVHHPG